MWGTGSFPSRPCGPAHFVNIYKKGIIVSVGYLDYIPPSAQTNGPSGPFESNIRINLACSWLSATAQIKSARQCQTV